MRKIPSLGKLLLGVWLILTGLTPWVHIQVGGYNQLLALLGIAAGVLILIGR